MIFKIYLFTSRANGQGDLLVTCKGENYLKIIQSSLLSTRKPKIRSRTCINNTRLAPAEAKGRIEISSRRGRAGRRRGGFARHCSAETRSDAAPAATITYENEHLRVAGCWSPATGEAGRDPSTASHRARVLQGQIETEGRRPRKTLTSARAPGEPQLTSRRFRSFQRLPVASGVARLR
jgi:hypothetical protein